MLPTLLAITAFLLLLVLYPYVLYPWVLRLLPTRPSEPAAPDAAPLTASLLFCARNEERALPRKLENLRSLQQALPSLEILAYSDASDDGTAQLLAEASGILSFIDSPVRTGKAAGMRQLVDRATGDVLVFSDANVLFADDAIPALLRHYGDPSVGAVAGIMAYENAADGATAAVGSAYWSMIERIRLLESRSGSMMGAGGAILSIRRSLYPDVPSHLLDDMIVSVSPMFSGYRAISAPDALAFEQMATTSVDEFRRRRRIACRALNTQRHLAPSLAGLSRLDRFKWFSHRRMRWLSGLFFGLALVSGTTALAVAATPPLAVAALGAGLGLTWLGHRFELGPVSKIANVLTAFLANTIGQVEAMRGKTYQTWDPPTTRGDAADAADAADATDAADAGR